MKRQRRVAGGDPTPVPFAGAPAPLIAPEAWGSDHAEHLVPLLLKAVRGETWTPEERKDARALLQLLIEHGARCERRGT
jgi:hypothetical protein